MAIPNIDFFVGSIRASCTHGIEELGQAVFELKQAPEDERFEFLLGVARHPDVRDRPGLPAYLAQQVLSRPFYLLELLKYGISHSDASRIRLWFRYLTPKLGFVTVARFLTGQIETEPVGVLKSLYWLPEFLPPNNRRAQEALQDLVLAARRARLDRYYGR